MGRLSGRFALVTGAGGPSADELAQRYADRSSRTAKEAPPSLGPPGRLIRTVWGVGYRL